MREKRRSQSKKSASDNRNVVSVANTAVSCIQHDRCWRGTWARTSHRRNITCAPFVIGNSHGLKDWDVMCWHIQERNDASAVSAGSSSPARIIWSCTHGRTLARDHTLAVNVASVSCPDLIWKNIFACTPAKNHLNAVNVDAASPM